MNTVKIRGYATYRLKNKKNLLRLLIEKKIPITALCNGQGRCGLCRIKIIRGVKQPDKLDQVFIPKKQLNQGYRLACRYLIDNDIEVSPQISRKNKAVTNVSSAIMALDIGTTIIKGAVIDLQTKQIKQAKVINRQTALGGDIISRLSAAVQGQYPRLRALLQNSISELRKNLGLENTRFMTVVGNPVMLSFYLNKPIKSLATYPFKADIKSGVYVKKPRQYIFPIIGGFIGADTIAGILASGFFKKKGYYLYLDLGTNGEVTLINKDKIIATSTAAGPAFEGVGLSWGSLAIPGAINHIELTKNRFRIYTIKNKPAIGFCASGMIQLLAVLLDNALLTEDGRLKKTIKINEFEIKQSDIRQLQLAIGALHTGIKILLDYCALKPQDIKETVITGEFGARLKINAIKRIGLLPRTIKSVRFDNDLPLKGAVQALRNQNLLNQAEEIKDISEHLELALQPDFQKTFVQSLKFKRWD